MRFNPPSQFGERAQRRRGLLPYYLSKDLNVFAEVTVVRVMPHSVPHPPDADLILAAQTGDQASLEALLARWWPKIRRWCLVELADRSLADDASQEVLIRVMRHIGTCDARRPFPSWLRRLVHNAAVDLRTKRGPVLAFEHEETETPRLDQAHDLRRGATRARAAFRSLSVRQRRALELCDHLGLSTREAAAELEIEASTVRVLLHQGRKTLRERLVAELPDLIALLREAR